jgi:hypothetical protein
LYSNSKFKSINKNKILKEKKEGTPYLAGQPKQASAAQQQPEANPAAAQYLTQPTKETVHTVSVIKGRPTPSFSSPVATGRRRTSATSSPTIRSTPDVVSHSRTSLNHPCVRVYPLAPRFMPNTPPLSAWHPGHCRRRDDELDLVVVYKYARSSALKP